jgi:hypothetical protein
MSLLLQMVCASLADSGGHKQMLMGTTDDVGVMGGVMGR